MSIRQKHRMWTIWGSIWLMCELEWNRALSVMALTSDASMSAFEPQADILTIHCDILVKKLLTVIKLKFIVEQDICFRLSLVLWHLFSQGSVAMHLRCGGIFSDYFIIVYFWVDDDFFFKLINILQGLQSRVGCRVFVTHEVVVSTVE